MRNHLGGLYGWCVACDRVALVEMRDDPARYDVVFFAKCHGGRETLAVSASEIRAARVPADIPRLSAWARSLFAADASPDVRELLNYNREPWRLTP